MFCTYAVCITLIATVIATFTARTSHLPTAPRQLPDLIQHFQLVQTGGAFWRNKFAEHRVMKTSTQY